MALLLLNGVQATTSAPTLATDGFALTGHAPGAGQYYWLKVWDAGAINVKGAGTGALTFQGIVYLYDTVLATWMPAGMAATIADRGKLNDANTITGTTTLAHTQPIMGLSAYSRIALQASTLTGTGMTVSVSLVQRYLAV